jgi:hypothetical protein
MEKQLESAVSRFEYNPVQEVRVVAEREMCTGTSGAKAT